VGKLAGLWRYVIRRILFMIPVFIAVSLMTFLVTNAAGDPVQIVLRGLHNVTPAQKQALADYYHTNVPVFERYFLWVADFLRGNLGNSLDGGTVASKILPWVGTTMELQLTSLVFALAIGVPVGIYSAKHQYTKTDGAVTTVAIFGYSMPTFWLGIQSIIFFSLYLKVLPFGGAGSGTGHYWWGSPELDALAHLILPVSVLTFVSLATFVRLMRANMLDVIRQDYILAARASGVKESLITYKHAMKNAITPIVTTVGIGLGLSLSGAPATETAFSWPGLGYAFVQAASNLNLPVVQDIVMIITIMALAFNLLTDLSYAYLDPRVRLA
jgi:ABC-type dipeptide/oligopeptide/nickel transport system permease component